MQAEKSNLELALEYIKTLYGKPYRWGGDDPTEGFDCSGLAVEFLSCYGVIGPREDHTAQGLFDLLKKSTFPAAGSLVFYGASDTQVSHVEICLGRFLSIGASGGGRRVTNAEIAARENAYIKLRPIFRRNDIVGFRWPIKD